MQTTGMCTRYTEKVRRARTLQQTDVETLEKVREVARVDKQLVTYTLGERVNPAIRETVPTAKTVRKMEEYVILYRLDGISGHQYSGRIAQIVQIQRMSPETESNQATLQQQSVQSMRTQNMNVPPTHESLSLLTMNRSPSKDESNKKRATFGVGASVHFPRSLQRSELELILILLSPRKYL